MLCAYMEDFVLHAETCAFRSLRAIRACEQQGAARVSRHVHGMLSPLFV